MNRMRFARWEWGTVPVETVAGAFYVLPKNRLRHFQCFACRASDFLTENLRFQSAIIYRARNPSFGYCQYHAKIGIGPWQWQ